MDGVPPIGSTRGIFEIFVPGAFLLLNIAGAAYILPSSGNGAKLFISALASQPVPALAVLVCFGYLLGVVLRLLKTRAPDRWSGHFGCLLWKLKGQREKAEACLAEFPYFTYFEKVVTPRLPDAAGKFYREFWGKGAIPGNKEFFNYCKIIVNAMDERSGAEFYAAEALTRYVASMFYALLASFILVAVVELLIRSAGLLGLLGVYFVAIIVILRHLRSLRVKEVETVFVATMRNYVTNNWPRFANAPGSEDCTFANATSPGQL